MAMWSWRGARERRARFEAEILPHLGALYRFACALKAGDDAEDLVQATCARALERHETYRPGTNARAWLFTILRNELVSGLRRRERERGLEADTTAFAASDVARSVELLLLDRRWAEEIRVALAALGEAYRTPVYLRDIEGFSYREIADVMGSPLGTVMSRLARGRGVLRSLLLRQATERGLIRTERLKGSM